MVRIAALVLTVAVGMWLASLRGAAVTEQGDNFFVARRYPPDQTAPYLWPWACVMVQERVFHIRPKRSPLLTLRLGKSGEFSRVANADEISVLLPV